MKINLILYDNHYGLTEDGKMLVKLFRKCFRDRVDLRFVNFFDYGCKEADINIFLETVSYTLMKHASYNILIPNQEWFYRTWLPYLDKFDKILTKTHYASSIFRTLMKKHGKSDSMVQFIDWKSDDHEYLKTDKSYKKVLHVAGRSYYKGTQTLIDAWKPEYPQLTIHYNTRFISFETKEQDNITYSTKRLNGDEYKKLVNEHGIHVCCSEMEGYGHYIHEAKSTRAIVITTDASPMNDFIEDGKTGFLVEKDNKKVSKKFLGSRYFVSVEALQKVLDKVFKMDKRSLDKIGSQARQDYIAKKRKFEQDFKQTWIEIFKTVGDYKKNQKDEKTKKEEMMEMMKDENLPPISIITPTYNRRNFFKLAKYNVAYARYPIEKIEWIIVDDGTDPIEDLIPEDDCIKYYRIDHKMTIGEKRNFCVEKATHDYIVAMDDDDYYPPNSFKLRILELLQNNVDCVTCTTIGCFEINKLISMINVPPHQMSLGERASEASMCFKKSFWEEKGFNPNSQFSEAKDFLTGREERVRELSWNGVLVALMHNRNTSDKFLPSATPNGCHYGWSDELYLFITNLDVELTDEEKNERKKKMEKIEKKQLQEKKADGAHLMQS